jgi:hypothetical protein
LSAAGGTYQWTIAIPPADLAISPDYVLRFKVASSTYDNTTDEISSPGFVILEVASPTTSTSSSSTASSTSTSNPTTTTPNAQTSLSNPGSAGLSGGAKAGIAIGVIALVAAVAGLLYFFFLRGKRAGMGGEATSATSGTELVDKKWHPSPPAPSELGVESYRPSELSGDWQQHPTELPAR